MASFLFSDFSDEHKRQFWDAEKQFLPQKTEKELSVPPRNYSSCPKSVKIKRALALADATESVDKSYKSELQDQDVNNFTLKNYSTDQKQTSISSGRVGISELNSDLLRLNFDLLQLNSSFYI